MNKISECSPSEAEPKDIKEPIKWPSSTPHLIRMSEENSQLGVGAIIFIGFLIILVILLLAYVIIKSKGCV